MVGQRGVLFVLHRAVQTFVLRGQNSARVELHPVPNREGPAGGTFDWYYIPGHCILLYDWPQPREAIVKQISVTF